MNKTLNEPAGWKPHVVYEFVDVKRQTLVYWRDHIFPQNEKTHYSTYDILIYKIIKEYAIRRGIQISRLKQVDWKSISNDLFKLTFKGFSGKILNIDLNTHDYAIFDSIKDLDTNDGSNQYIQIDMFSNQVVNGLFTIGVEQYK